MYISMSPEGMVLCVRMFEILELEDGRIEIHDLDIDGKLGLLEVSVRDMKVILRRFDVLVMLDA